MKVDIDLSVFSHCGAACGVVTGPLEMSHIPRAGELLSFCSPVFPVASPIVTGLNLLLAVEAVLHTPTKHGSRVSLSLSSLVIPSTDYTQEVFRYFESGFGLNYDPFLDKDL